jgi:hypothetical protein
MKLKSLIFSLTTTFGLIGISTSAFAGSILERVNKGPGTGYGLNLYTNQYNSRINVYDLKKVDGFQRWNLPNGYYNNGSGLIASRGKISLEANSGYCIKPSYIGNNAPLYVVPCSQAPEFAVEDVYNGSFSDVRLRVFNTNFCINTPNVNLWNGGYTFLYQCASSLAGDTEQVWRRR